MCIRDRSCPFFSHSFTIAVFKTKFYHLFSSSHSILSLIHILELKETLDSLKNYTAGENITIDEDGKINAEVTGFYVLPTASEFVKGGIRVGEGLTMTDDVLSADKQFNYTAGANISISNTGVISATGGGEGGGVTQEYVCLLYTSRCV